jgi:hypothetical protein
MSGDGVMAVCKECTHYHGENGCQVYSWGEIRPSTPANQYCFDFYEPKDKRELK